MHLKKCSFTTVIFLVSFIINSTAQTCTGSLGDPIINIDFGSGNTFGPPLPPGTTSSLQYQAATCPSDGNYTITNFTSGCWPNDVVWHSAKDHTGNGNGFYMLVNASNQPSNFYIQTIDGLCGGTTYQFAAWLLNMCSVTGILPNITFTIENIDGTVLNSYDSGDIPILNPVTWQQYGFFFTTPPGISRVVLRMRNNAPGGVGNDLGLDDITFRPAGPAIVTSIAGAAADTLDICASDQRSFQFTSDVENCFGSTAYQWQQSADNGASWTNIPAATGTAYTRTTTGAGTFLYRLTVAQADNISISNCRVASTPIKVVIHPAPDVAIAGNTPKCSGETILLTASGGTSYQWTGPNGFTNNTAQVSIANAAAGSAGMYRITVTDSTSCTAVDSVMVEVSQRPTAKFSVATAACENLDIAFTNQSVPNGGPITKWSWSFGEGGVSNATSPVHLFKQPNNYKVSLIVENGKGCKSDTVTKDIVVHPLPLPAFVMPGICLADPFANFIDASTISDQSESGFSYAWDFGDTNAGGANPNTSVLKDPGHRYSAVGIYQVKLSITSKDGCVKDTVQSFTVNGAQPVARFNIDPAVSFCSDTDVVISNAATVDFGSITRVEIYWDYQRDASIKTIDSFATPGKKYTFRYPLFNYPAAMAVSIRYVVYSGITCVNEVTKIISLKAAPDLVFDILNNVCVAVPAYTLRRAFERTGMQGSGVYSGDGIKQDSVFDPAAAGAGLHTIRYVFSGANGCNAFAEKVIEVFPQPMVDAGADQILLRGGYALLSPNVTGSNLQYEWTPDSYLDNSHIATPKVTPLDSITYTLAVTSANGCVASDQVFVNVVNDIYVPTAFSPNDDGLNDTWRIPFLGAYGGASVDVFNRFGELVYHASGSSANWDGKFKGKPMPSGSYSWMVKPGGGRRLMYGMVTIIR